VGRGRRGIKAGRLTGNTKHVCILIFLCRNTPLQRFLLSLSALGTKKGTGRRVWRAVVGLRGSGRLVGGSAVGRVVWSGFGAALMELGSSLGALGVFLIPDDSRLFSTISGCLVSSLVAIGLLVVEISLSRLSSPRLHALMQGVRKYVVSEGYVAYSMLRPPSLCRGILQPEPRNAIIIAVPSGDSRRGG
jgi:hypothetical protein